MNKARMLPFLCLLLACLALGSAAADRTVTLTFTGDVTLGGEKSLQGKAASFSGHYRTYGADYFFANVRTLFETDDITVVNLEGVLSDSTSDEKKSKQYRFIAPTEYVSVLTGSSVEAVNLANNHTADFGTQGFESTQATLDAAGIGYFYLGRTWIWEQDGLRIGFLSMSGSQPGLYKNQQWIRETIAALKEQDGCSTVVVSLHTGKEYATKHSTDQRTYAELAVDAGADLVVMHHPHILEGVDIIGSRYVFYSLGNFCFGGNNKCYGGPKDTRAADTCVLRVTFTFSDDGEYLGQQPSIYPAYTSGTYPENNFQPVLLSGEEALTVLQRIRDDTDFTLEPFDETLGCITQPYLPADGSTLSDPLGVIPSDRTE